MYACYETSLPRQMQESEVNFARIQGTTIRAQGKDGTPQGFNMPPMTNESHIAWVRRRILRRVNSSESLKRGVKGNRKEIEPKEICLDQRAAIRIG